MKTLISLLILAAGSATLCAQNSLSVTADIPFAFYVGDRQMPAGEYQTVQLGQVLVMVQHADGKEAAFRSMIPASAKDRPTTSSLVFRNYGDRYFLAKIWRAGSQRGAEFSKSKKEREAVSSTLVSATRPTTVIILARSR